MKQDQDLFPHLGFPIRLEYQDNRENRICWFQCQDHLDKHLSRYNLKAKDIKITYQNESVFTPISVIDKDEEVLPRKRGRKPKQQLFSSLEQFFE